MLCSIAEAEALVLANVPPLPAEDCPLAQAAGRVLREGIRADRDLPPFDRATLDGIALARAAWVGGVREFAVEGVQAAGTIRRKLAAPATGCIEVMTGAPLPEGCDTIVPYEEIEIANGVARLRGGAEVGPGRAVHTRGGDAAAGEVLVPAGARLGAAEIGIAASVGRATLRVAMRPRIAVVASGDELVEVETAPAPHQIRRSNDHALRALLLAAGAGAVERFHLRDVEAEIEATLRRLIAEFDWLVLTGGVSKGRFDFLPQVLERLRVAKKFHGVAQRPGKPFWFGVTPRHTPVFALPGNPVAALACAARYAAPALAQAVGVAPASPRTVRLAAAVPGLAKLAQFVPVRLRSDETAVLFAEPAPSNTSGDFAGLAGTDGFVELPAQAGAFAEGTVARFRAWL